MANITKKANKIRAELLKLASHDSDSNDVMEQLAYLLTIAFDEDELKSLLRAVRKMRVLS